MGTFSAATIVADLVPALNSDTVANLTAATETQLYEWIDAAMNRLARTVGLFVRRDATLTTAVSTVAAPARHLSTLHLARDDGTSDWRPLRPASVAELEALDDSYPTATAASPTHHSEDQQGGSLIRLYKIPSGSVNLALIYHETRAEITKAAPTVDAPEVIRDAFFYGALAEARRGESDEAMPEIAEYCGERVNLYEQAFRAYWGDSA